MGRLAFVLRMNCIAVSEDPTVSREGISVYGTTELDRTRRSARAGVAIPCWCHPGGDVNAPHASGACGWLPARFSPPQVLQAARTERGGAPAPFPSPVKPSATPGIDRRRLATETGRLRGAVPRLIPAPPVRHPPALERPRPDDDGGHAVTLPDPRCQAQLQSDRSRARGHLGTSGGGTPHFARVGHGPRGEASPVARASCRPRPT